ncbi:glycosyltransferase family 2 protein [Clostridium sp. CF011]|uniref:glycosyltransferase family 2 protein n=1 Tax=Clostridium sp. CF011 TaxID=2843318 RepID=UPI001C0C7FAD|nr:glycosyltransferase family 2 protein [Clostridium sp. CF011]MBU3091659.1 glycosyltransferase family 2 protein [Clostridium sp. CF011]WAG69371.1 glycosyltransferase family 2 protein [Clostridium sp. CF011]
MDLSIVIVSYNTVDLLRDCLSSVIQNTENIEYEIWVVDNQSKDGSATMVESEFPQIKLIRNSINGGFSQANNLAIRQCRSSKYVLILNPDTIVPKGTLVECVDFMEKDKEIGCLGCKVVKVNGTLDKACKRGFPSPWNSLCYLMKLDKLLPNNKKFGGYNATFIHEDEESEIDSLVGAFMMLRKEAIEQVGLLDETFFMYGEDIDWCYRIKQAGWKNYYHPKVRIVHYKGESSKKQSTRMIGEFHKSMFIFYNKHYKNKYNTIVNLLTYLGIYSKWGLSLTMNATKKEKKVF